VVQLEVGCLPIPSTKKIILSRQQPSFFFIKITQISSIISMKTIITIMMIGTAFLATATKSVSSFAIKHGCSTATAFAGVPSTRTYSRTSLLSLAANPKVFFDMEVGGKDVGRIEFELRADVVPKTGT
jgi:hypothetical protein